ncbi:MAG: HK97 family phage prohead protease [archaeon]|nr:HK97 family phage prohead protease [archaeon]
MADKTLMEKINQGRQYRSMDILCEKRTDDNTESYVVEGYASTFNQPYVLFNGDDWEYREQVDAHAFDECKLDDCILQYDHCGKVYARTSNGTLEVKTDEHGLFIRANLGGTEDGRKLYEEIKGGYTTKMSFGFTVTEDEELRTSENGKDVYLRTIKKIGRLYDVSAVSLPANDGTEISARSLVDGVIARRTQELSEEEQKKADEERKALEVEEQNKANREREKLALELEISLSL